jgi:feruloyl-CoA synthase
MSTEASSESRAPDALDLGVAVEVARVRDGIILRSLPPLGDFARCTGEFLEQWARSAPERPFLLERAGGAGWRGVTYGEALHRVRRIGAGLLGQAVSRERPVAILSENSVEHAILTLSCLHVGVPVAPISPAYSRLSRAFSKLRVIVRALSPGIIYVSDPARFAPALSAIRDLHDGMIVSGSGVQPPEGALALEALESARDDDSVEHAFRAITPDTIAKVLFTSGSTGEPKGVINTQRMLCSNQQALAQAWPFLDEPPVLVDWLPWHHTYGGNHNFNLVLRNGGTLYIDRGRPLPGQFEETLANLREIAPTLSLNVPRAYDLLVGALRADAALRERFFSRLRLISYAGAALPQHVWQSLQALAQQTLGRAVMQNSSWGLTETAPTATTCSTQPERAGIIGLPVASCELKLVPNGDKLEARVRGPNVTPGYFRDHALTAAFFDDEGFFKTGDALRFVDPERPELGLLFDGRVGEDFKLSTATWVNVGALRLEAIAALSPVAEDVVVAGHDRDEIGLLIFPNLEACRRLCGELPSDTAPAVILEHPTVRARVGAGLALLERNSGGSSRCARRALLMPEPPSIDAGEVTDKGYINQRAVLLRRAALVATLYRVPLDSRVILPIGSEAYDPSRAT